MPLSNLPILSIITYVPLVGALALVFLFAKDRPGPIKAFATFVVASYSGAIALAKAEQAADPLKACARQLAAVMQRPDRRSGGRLSKPK